MFLPLFILINFIGDQAVHAKENPCDPHDPEVVNFPLIAAAIIGDGERSERLLREGADINQRSSKSGLTPLICAIVRKNFELAKFFVGKGANIQLSDSLQRDALSYAAQTNEVALFQDLLRRGADPTKFNGRGTAPLNYAIYWYVFHKQGRTSAIIEALLEHPKVNINAPCQSNGERPIETAAYAGNAPLVGLFLRRGADPKGINFSLLHSVS